MRLTELLSTDFGKGAPADLNCAERLFYGANTAYELGYDEEVRKLAGLFGGGMYSGSVCGAVTGSLMALGKLIIDSCAHNTDNASDVANAFLDNYREKAGALDCAALRPMYHTPETKCYKTQQLAAEVLDDLVISLGLMDESGNMLK